jgi:hypothetical protein
MIKHERTKNQDCDTQYSKEAKPSSLVDTVSEINSEACPSALTLCGSGMASLERCLGWAVAVLLC